MNCTSLQNVNGLKNWRVYDCKSFKDMFNGCSSLQNVDVLRQWSIKEGANLEGIFDNCNSLKNIPNFNSGCAIY